MRWVFLIVLLLIVLLCWTRVGVRAELGEELVLSVRVGLLRFQVLPARRKAKPPKEKKEKKPKRERKERKPFPKPTAGDIREAVAALVPPLGRALRRLWRGLRIAPVEISAVLGGADDPAGTASLYGQICGALWALPPLPRGREIALSVDYGAPRTQVRGTVGVSLRIAAAIAAAWTVGFPAARYLICYLRRKKRQAAAERAGKEGS